MPDFLTLFLRWWKLIAGFVVAIALVTAGILLALPRQYVSTVTALPATTINFDKSKIFNENIQGLYSSLGGSEDLDRVLGTAALDTIYFQLVAEFDLIRHYKVAKTRLPQYQAMKELRQNIEVFKTEYSELRIKVWDEDRELAARMANALFEKFQQMHQRLQNATNDRILNNLRTHYTQLQNDFVRATDSIAIASPARQQLLLIRTQAITRELSEYERLINEYNLMSTTKPQVLLLVEAARPAFKPDRPKLLPTFVMVCFSALVFAILLSLFLESRKNPH